MRIDASRCLSPERTTSRGNPKGWMEMEFSHCTLKTSYTFIRYVPARRFCESHAAVRHDLCQEGAVFTSCGFRFASGRAMIRAGNNDTSVIRSPAIRKAGRLDSYGAVRKPPPDDFPPELSSVFSGVSWTNVRKIITFVEKSPEISFSAAFHYIPHT